MYNYCIIFYVCNFGVCNKSRNLKKQCISMSLILAWLHLFRLAMWEIQNQSSKEMNHHVFIRFPWSWIPFQHFSQTTHNCKNEWLSRILTTMWRDIAIEKATIPLPRYLWDGIYENIKMVYFLLISDRVFTISPSYIRNTTTSNIINFHFNNTIISFECHSNNCILPLPLHGLKALKWIIQPFSLSFESYYLHAYCTEKEAD